MFIVVQMTVHPWYWYCYKAPVASLLSTQSTFHYICQSPNQKHTHIHTVLLSTAKHFHQTFTHTHFDGRIGGNRVQDLAEGYFDT